MAQKRAQLPNLSGMNLPQRAVPTGTPIVFSDIKKSRNGLVGIAINRIDDKHDLRFYLGTDDPHVKVVMEMLRTLGDRYKGYVVDGPHQPKYPPGHALAGQWKPLLPEMDQYQFSVDRQVIPPDAGVFQPYHGTLMCRPGLPDANGRILTSEPWVTITASVGQSGGIFKSYSVRALTLDRGTLRVGHFRVM